MRLSYRLCDDWLIFAQADDGSWWIANTETWPEWLDAAENAGVNPTDYRAVERLASAEDSVERHMVPRVTAWNTELSPTASAVSHPLGVVGFARWQRVADEDTHDLAARATEIPLRSDGTPIPCEWPKGCGLASRESVIDPLTGQLSLCRAHAREVAA
ncbi:MAG: hypothetical protein LC798_11905 [Chloroflexi bacterium]|nr:hypothetical protein [Chloroflexota bacterium]